MSPTRVVLLFLRREVRDIRTNKQVWPAYAILTLIAVVLPVAFAVVIPEMIQAAQRGTDPEVESLLRFVRSTGEFAGMSPAEALTRYLQRNFAGFYLLIPVTLSSIGAAYSIVGEKQQRTLEPILATPITDAQFLFGKLLAALLPGIACAWLAAALAAVGVDAVSWSRFGSLVLPDRIWAIGVVLLGPLLGAAAVLTTMLASARATDPQAAMQFTGLALMPAFFLLLAIFGRILTLHTGAAVAACALVGMLDVGLFRANVVKFRREEILTKWR